MRTKDLLQEIILFATVVIGLFISISLASPALDYLLGVDLFLEYRTEGDMHIIQSNNKYALITGILIASIVWIIRILKKMGGWGILNRY